MGIQLQLTANRSMFEHEMKKNKRRQSARPTFRVKSFSRRTIWPCFDCCLSRSFLASSLRLVSIDMASGKRTLCSSVSSNFEVFSAALYELVRPCGYWRKNEKEFRIRLIFDGICVRIHTRKPYAKFRSIMHNDTHL